MPRTYFFWDPVEDSIIQERDENGTVTAEYTREPDGTLISENRGGVERQYHFDPQGNTLALTDDNQNVTDTFAYNASGEVTERTGTTATPFQYKGQHGYYFDENTGDYMVQRRPLDPTQEVLPAFPWVDLGLKRLAKGGRADAGYRIVPADLGT